MISTNLKSDLRDCAITAKLKFSDRTPFTGNYT